MFVAYVRRVPFVLAAIAWLAGCTPFIADYSAEAYKNATTLKAETLALMDKAGDPYLKRKSEVEVLTTKIDAAYEYTAGLPNNELSTRQWQLLRNPDGHLYGSFMRIWRTSGKINEGYRADKKAQIAAAFDVIICLEVNKKDSKSCSSISASASQ